MIPEPIARVWCQALAAGLAYQDIRPGDVPYLRRYFVAGWRPGAPAGPAVYLHHFTGSDPDDAVHSHPWAIGVSLLLVGRYTEHRCDALGAVQTRTYGPGDVNVLQASDRHRVTLIDRDVWSLFLAGAYSQPWAFFPLETLDTRDTK